MKMVLYLLLVLSVVRADSKFCVSLGVEQTVDAQSLEWSL